MIKIYHDIKNKFREAFDTKIGFYIRTGILDENGKDTGKDPFMRDFPALVDVGIMGHCIHSRIGGCLKAGVECYQGGNTIVKPNMTLENYKKIIDQCKDRLFQVALGGRGDPNKHVYFEEILKYTRENGIVPNYTTSGFDLEDKEVDFTKEYCGAVAVSMYHQDYTWYAIKRFISEGCKTNIHFVLSNKSLSLAIDFLNGLIPKSVWNNLNALIFLLHKPIGLGTIENCVRVDDERLKHFFELVDNWKGPFKIGFDSCSIPGIINFTKKINMQSVDACEAGRYSCFVSSEMNMVPCSFDTWKGIDLNQSTIEEGWNSELFNNIRTYMKAACPNCEDRENCFGGCPITGKITLCNRKEKHEI